MAELLSDDEIGRRLADLPGWTYDAEHRCISRAFTFPNFIVAFSFMTGLALTAERMNHHPDQRNVYNRVELTLWTHSAGGVTELDFTLAAKADALATRGTPAK